MRPSVQPQNLGDILLLKHWSYSNIHSTRTQITLSDLSSYLVSNSYPEGLRSIVAEENTLDF